MHITKDFIFRGCNRKHFEVFRKIHPSVTDYKVFVVTGADVPPLLNTRLFDCRIGFETKESQVVFGKWWKKYKKLFNVDPMSSPYPCDHSIGTVRGIVPLSSFPEGEELMQWFYENCKGKVCVLHTRRWDRDNMDFSMELPVVLFEKATDAVMFKLTHG